jgi:hypothetical protein
LDTDFAFRLTKPADVVEQVRYFQEFRVSILAAKGMIKRRL